MKNDHDNTTTQGDAMIAQAKRLLPRLILAWTLAVIALLALAAGFMNFDDIGMIWTVPIEAVALVILCTAMMDLIYAARWRIWLRIAEPNHTFRIRRLWTFVAWSRFGSQFLPIPAVSVAIRAAAVKTAAGVSTKRAVCSVAADPVLDLYQFLLVVPITAALLTGHLSASQAAGGVCVALLIGAICLMSLFPWLVRLIETARRFVNRTRSQSNPAPVQPTSDGLGPDEPSSACHTPEPQASACAAWQTQPPPHHTLSNAAVTAFPSFDRWTLLNAYGLTVLRYAFVALRLWTVAIAVGLTELTASFFAATGTVTQAAHMATITPGALGALEGGWFAALRAVGVSPHQATLFVTAQRLFIWLAIAVLATLLTAMYFAFAKRDQAGTVSNKDGSLSSPLTKGGSRGVLQPNKNLPQSHLIKEGSKKSNDLCGSTVRGNNTNADEAQSAQATPTLPRVATS